MKRECLKQQKLFEQKIGQSWINNLTYNYNNVLFICRIL
jgi:hypothetical protein